jgi:hypothetical protein
LLAFTGIYNLPPICFGYIAGGLIMKKFKITVKQAAHIGCWLSMIEYLLYFLTFLMTCDNSPVAGITTSYDGYVVFLMSVIIFKQLPVWFFYLVLHDQITCLRVNGSGPFLSFNFLPSVNHMLIHTSCRLIKGIE